MSIIYNQSAGDRSDRTAEGARVDFIVHLPRSRDLRSAPRRVTMRPGDRMDWWKRDRTEEGWSSNSTLYLRHDGDRISMLVCDDGDDGMGTFSYCTLFECPLDRLHAGDRQRPAWHFHGEDTA